MTMPAPDLSTLIPFTFNDTLPVRVILRDNEPWFVASDIAAVLGYRNTPDLVRMLDEDEKGTHIVRTLGGEQTMTVISESGLYACVLKSRREEAKPFRRWVTGEVLPAIRKSGTYSVAPAPTAGVISEAQLKELQQLVHNVGFEFMWFKDSAVWQLWAGIRHQTGTSNRDIPLAQFDGIKAQLLAKKELACTFFRQQCDREAAFIKNVLRVPHAEYQAPLPDKEPQRAIYAEGLAKPWGGDD